MGHVGFGEAKAGRRAALATCLLSILGLCLVQASKAVANPTPFTWAGISTTTEEWSAPENWEGDTAPTASTEIETLTFPRLTSTACTDEQATHPCYFSFNDVSGLIADSVQLDDGDEYLIGGEPLTLGGGGLAAYPASSARGPAGDLIEMPIDLSASQKWRISDRSGDAIGENGFLLGGNVTGLGHELAVELSNGPALIFDNSTEVGPLKIDGSQPGESNIDNGVFELLKGTELNSVDNEAVDLSDVYFSGSGAVGALHTNHVTLGVGGLAKQAGKLEASSVTLDSETGVGFEVRGTAPTPGIDYGELVSHGPVNLAGAFVAMYVPKPCEAPPAGQVYTLVSTSGELIGSFGDAPNGSEIPVEFFKECGTQPPEMLRIEYHRDGTNTVTGTVVIPSSPSQPTSEGTSTLSGAIEPLPVNTQIEKEFHEHPPWDNTPASGSVAASKTTASTGNVSLVGSTMTVQSSGEAQVKLACTGTRTCAGKLTLTGKSTPKKGKKAKTDTIGTATFSIPAGKTATIDLKLNAAGKALLSTDHGRLDATLSILKSSPSPSQTHTDNVQLVPRKAHGHAKSYRARG